MWAQWKPSSATGDVLQSKICPPGQLLIVIMTQSDGVYMFHQNELLYPHEYYWTYNMKRAMDAKHWCEELNSVSCTHTTLQFSNVERAGFSNLHYETCSWSSCQEALSQHVGHHSCSPACHRWSKLNMLNISTWILFICLIVPTTEIVDKYTSGKMSH